MKQSGSSSSAVMPQSEVKRGNFSTLLQNFRSGAQTDIAACCRLLAACNCDRHFLLAFAYLPEMLKLRPLTESEATEMISVMPMDLLQRMISNEKSENSRHYRDLAVDIISVLLSSCSAEDLLKFKCLIEPLRTSIVSKRKWDVQQLENMCDALLRISGDLLSVNDVAEIIDVLSKTLNEVTEQLPSMILLHSITDLLKRLVNEREYIPMDELMRYTFPSRLKVVIKRLIQTNNISDDYRMMCFILCALLVCLFDFQWFGGDPQFLILLSALTHVELRLILDKPEMINVEDLISCATLGESFIQCIEEGDFLDDQQATVVGRNCQECVSYVCEYLIECRRDETVELQSNVEIVPSRLICSYLAIGGSDTINSSLIDDVLLALVDIARRSCEHGDASVVEMLLPSLPNFNSLPSSCLDLTVLCLERQSSVGDYDRLSAKVARVVDELKDNNNWYSEGSLTSAKELAQKLGSRDLIEAFSALK